ncbi:MAG: hypothetical protein IJN21_02255 [Clostridia bacterium]|nr:hypothetical protein [Clostridia bacterium]
MQKRKKHGNLKRWLLSGLAVFAAVGLLCCAFYALRIVRSNDESRSSHPSQNSQAGALALQKSNLYKERDRLQREYFKRIQGIGTATLLFTQPDASLMEIVAPMLQESNLTGMIAFSTDFYPGAEGCITPSEYQQLEEAGWEVCLMWDGKTQLSEWMSAMTQRLTDAGIMSSFTVYVPEGLYDQALLAQARELKLHALIHHGEGAEETVQYTLNVDDVCTPMAISWHVDNASKHVDSVTSTGGSIVLEVKDEILQDESYNRLFQSMLETLVKWRDEDKLHMVTIEQAISYRRGVLTESMELEEELRRQLEALDLQIEAIDEQIAALRRSE